MWVHSRFVFPQQADYSITPSATNQTLMRPRNHEPSSLSLSAEFAKPDLPEWLGSLARLIEAGSDRLQARPVHLFGAATHHDATRLPMHLHARITARVVCHERVSERAVMMMMLLIAAAHLALHNLCANSASHQHRRRVHKARRAKQSSTHNALINYPPKISPLIFYLCWAVCDLINVRRALCLSAWPNGIERAPCLASPFAAVGRIRSDFQFECTSNTHSKVEYHLFCAYDARFIFTWY